MLGTCFAHYVSMLVAPKFVVCSHSYKLRVISLRGVITGVKVEQPGTQD